MTKVTVLIGHPSRRVDPDFGDAAIDRLSKHASAPAHRALSRHFLQDMPHLKRSSYKTYLDKRFTRLHILIAHHRTNYMMVSVFGNTMSAQR